MNLSRLVAYNTLIQIFGKAITVIFGIITTALLTNYLGPAGFGDYIFALSFVAIFSGIADWGTTLITVREAARKPADESQIFGNVLFLRLNLSLLAVFLVWLTISFFPLNSSNPEALHRLVILSSVLILLFSLKTSLGIIFQTKLKMDKLVLVDLSASFLTLVFSFLIIKADWGLPFVIVGIILANILAILLSFFLARPVISFNFSFSSAILRQITFEALPMGGILVLFSVYNRIDALILQALKGSGTVGIYGLAYRIYEVLVLGAFYLMNSLLPILSREKDRNRLCQIYQKVFDVLILAGLLTTLATIVFAPLAIGIIALTRAREFFISISLLQILGLAVFVSFLNHLTGYTIVVLGQQRRYFLISIAALFFNILANLWLIPVFSYYAAAWITVLTELLVFVLTSLLVAKTLGFTPSFLSFPKTARELITNKGRLLF